MAGCAAIQPGFRAAELVVAEAALAKALPYLRAAHASVLRAHLPDQGQLEAQLRTLVLRTGQLGEKTGRYAEAAHGQPERSEG